MVQDGFQDCVAGSPVREAELAASRSSRICCKHLVSSGGGQRLPTPQYPDAVLLRKRRRPAHGAQCDLLPSAFHFQTVASFIDNEAGVHSVGCFSDNTTVPFLLNPMITPAASEFGILVTRVLRCLTIPYTKRVTWPTTSGSLLNAGLVVLFPTTKPLA